MAFAWEQALGAGESWEAGLEIAQPTRGSCYILIQLPARYLLRARLQDRPWLFAGLRALQLELKSLWTAGLGLQDGRCTFSASAVAEGTESPPLRSTGNVAITAASLSGRFFFVGLLALPCLVKMLQLV